MGEQSAMIANSEGGEAVTDFLQMLRQAMPDPHMEFEDVFRVGGRVALCFSKRTEVAPGGSPR